MKKSVYKSEVYGTVNTPCSKSYAQRALAAALLSEGESRISNIELCDDTRNAMKVITDLGATVTPIDEHTYIIKGGLNPITDNINVGESGLATRLFTPIAALCNKKITVNGTGTMLGRPLDMMIEPLKALGAEVTSNGFLPISVKGPMRGGDTKVDGSVSSQFITGLLMALPLAKDDSTIYVDMPNSLPYLSMTVDMARRFGVGIDHDRSYSEFFIEGGQDYTHSNIAIEGDWSSAAFMLVAGAVAGKVTIPNMHSASLQADTAIIDILAHSGAEITTTNKDITVARNELKAFEFDATHCPDLFPILAVLAANCDGITRIKGTDRLKYKESDRAKAIMSEFTKIGIDIEIADNYMTVKGGTITGGTVDSRNDHRIAMAAAIAGLTSTEPVVILNAEAVTKSYPRFWSDFESILTRNA